MAFIVKKKSTNKTYKNISAYLPHIFPNFEGIRLLFFPSAKENLKLWLISNGFEGAQTWYLFQTKHLKIERDDRSIDLNILTFG